MGELSDQYKTAKLFKLCRHKKKFQVKKTLLQDSHLVDVSHKKDNATTMSSLTAL